MFWYKLVVEARRPRGKMLLGARSEWRLARRWPLPPATARRQPALAAAAAAAPASLSAWIDSSHPPPPPPHYHWAPALWLTGSACAAAAAAANEALERDMFGLIWGPTLAAVSVVLDNASEAGAVQRALDCLLLAARMAAYHQVGGRAGGSGECKH